MTKITKTRNGLLAGGAAVIGAGTLLALPLGAFAQDDDGTWFDDALSGLVDDGTLTQAQADAVEEALVEARPERGPGHRGGFRMGAEFGFRVHASLSEAAAAIGIEERKLAEALREGQTIAEVAEANGVDPQAVIDAMVATVQQRLDEAVAEGRIDENEATERADEATQRITELVNEGLERRRPFGPHRDAPRFTEDSNDGAETPSTESPTTESPTTTTG